MQEVGGSSPPVPTSLRRPLASLAATAGQASLGEAARLRAKRAVASAATGSVGGRNWLAGEVVIAFDRGPRRDDRVRINERIRVREIRVIDDTGRAARHHAAAASAGPGARQGAWISWRSPPRPCRRSAGSWTSGSTSTEQQKRARQAKKHQKVILVKEIKFRPKVDEHDYQFKKKHIERFIARR